MDIVLAQIIVELACDCVRLTDLLRLETLAFEHIVEVSVAADIQLHCALKLDSTFAEETGQYAVYNCCTYLALDVITDHRQIGFFEAVLPVLLTCNKTGMQLTKPTPA